MNKITAQQAAQYDQDRRPELYGTLVLFLLLNNITVAARLWAHYRTRFTVGVWISLEDVFVFLSGVRGHIFPGSNSRILLTLLQVCVNVIIGNLFSCTASPTKIQGNFVDIET